MINKDPYRKYGILQVKHTGSMATAVVLMLRLSCMMRTAEPA